MGTLSQLATALLAHWLQLRPEPALGWPHSRRASIVAFVLSGGSSHGAVQVGMLRALAEAGIEPDAVYGTSAGAVNASVIAQLPAAEGLDALAAAWRGFVRKPPLRPSFTHSAVALLRRRPALIDPSPLRARLLDTFGDARIEDATIPLHVVATNLLDGREHLFAEGRLVDVLMASCAVPGLFPPVEIDGTPYVDGLLYGAPTRPAIDAGHNTLFLLLTNSKMPHHETATSWWGIARRAATMVMWNQLLVPGHECADDIIIHTIPVPTSMARVGRWDFRHTETLLSDSYETASRWLARFADEELVS